MDGKCYLLDGMADKALHKPEKTVYQLLLCFSAMWHIFNYMCGTYSGRLLQLYPVTLGSYRNYAGKYGKISGKRRNPA